MDCRLEISLKVFGVDAALRAKARKLTRLKRIDVSCFVTSLVINGSYWVAATQGSQFTRQPSGLHDSSQAIYLGPGT
jgi:hypothetical protein